MALTYGGVTGGSGVNEADTFQATSKGGGIGSDLIENSGEILDGVAKIWAAAKGGGYFPTTGVQDPYLAQRSNSSTWIILALAIAGLVGVFFFLNRKK